MTEKQDGAGKVVRFPEIPYFPLARLPQQPPIADSLLSMGWRELEPFANFYDGQFIVCTGTPGHGKSTFGLNLVCNLAHDHGRKSFIFVPENERNIYAKLKKIWGARDDFDDFANNYVFVKSAIEGEYTFNNLGIPPRTMQSILWSAHEAIQNEGCYFCMIDPWNEIEHFKPKDILMTDYVSGALRSVKEFTRRHECSTMLIAHPTKSGYADDKIPTLGDIEQSAHWFNKADLGLVVHRELNSATTSVIIQKVREDDAGRTGACDFLVLNGKFISKRPETIPYDDTIDTIDPPHAGDNLFSRGDR